MQKLNINMNIFTHPSRMVAIMLFMCISMTASAIPMRALGDSLTAYANEKAQVGKVSVKRIRTSDNSASIYTDKTLSGLSLSPAELKDLRRCVSKLVFGNTDGNIQIFSDGYELDELVPMRYRSVEPMHVHGAVAPLVKNTDKPYKSPNGLDGKHIALWGSHGWYYNKQLDRWLWQRARLWTTVEDLYTSSYTMPYLVPMLENAGAVVIQPRERDTQTNMVIVEKSSLREEDGKTIAETIVPEEGEYGIYIRYKSNPNANSRTKCDVEHKDQKTTYTLNMQMGAGTWVYIGKHAFSPQQSARIHIHAPKQFISAVRLGGGIDTTAGVPRFAVGASEYLRFANIPDSILDYTNGENTYTNDYACRGQWVNYLLGGSQLAPQERGLRIPIDMSMAFHSDAGVRQGDSIIGTLLIYYNRDDNNSKTLPLGDSRLHCRYLADYVQTQIVEDMRALHTPLWTRRSLKNAGYAEARQPLVPSFLLELLSHQNMNDMRYGLDPKVKFTISRAIYKGILKYLTTARGEKYVVQPLPVLAFSATVRPADNEDKQDSIILRWQPTVDPLEKTAKAQYYIVYTRQTRSENGQTIAGDWDDGKRVESTRYAFVANRGVRYDFRVAAGNKGGTSMPSETLCAYIAPEAKGTALVVNNFSRVAAPTFFADSLYAGINPQSYAVADGKDISFMGEQYDYERNSKWLSDDNCGWGSSYADHQFTLTAGNTHDYPVMHGRVLTSLGYSYGSCSTTAISDSTAFNGYDMVDVICGKQRTEISCQQSAVSNQADTIYEMWPSALRAALVRYAEQGGGILLSGMYLGSEAKAVNDSAFNKQIIRYTYRGDHATRCGTILMNRAAWPVQIVRLVTQPNPDIICCENAQGILPALGAEAIGNYTDTGMTSGVAYNGDFRLIVLPFIMESVEDFGALYRNCVHYLTK